MVIFPLQAILAAAAAMTELMKELHTNPSDRVFADKMGVPIDLYRLVGLGEVEEQEREFAA
jgi:2-methylisocitrate lyase-like PEP mutase family enzyme